MEQYLDQIVENTRSKESTILVVSGKSCTVDTTYNPPIQLNPKNQYEMALVNLETYYSFPNIDKMNKSDGKKNYLEDY